METSTILHSITPEQINSLFEGLQKQLTELQQNFEPKNPAEYLTRSDVAQLFPVFLKEKLRYTVGGPLSSVRKIR